MDRYLSKIDYDFWKTSIKLPADLEKIVQSEFIVDNDCIVLKEVAKITSNPKFDTSIKKCEWEDFENHFHPDSYIDTENEIEYLKLALECGKRLAKHLNVELQKKEFRIQILFDETTMKDDELEFNGSSTVRFYKVRQDCEDIMRVNDLDNIKDIAVLEIEKKYRQQ